MFRNGSDSEAEQLVLPHKPIQPRWRNVWIGRGRSPMLLVPGPRDGNLYNFTDPESHMMKKTTNADFGQDYNAQIAVDQASSLIVKNALSNCPNDSQMPSPLF